MTPLSRATRSALLGAGVALSVGLAACGGSSSDGGADPATFVPAAAPIYVEATVRPTGELKENTLAVAKKLLNTPDPEAQIKKFLKEASDETSSGINYEQDVASWLGEDIGFFVTEIGADSDDLQGALLLSTTNKDKAAEALETDIREPDKAGEPKPKITEEDYNGVKVLADAADDTAEAVLDEFAIVGSLKGVKAAIDASKSDKGALAGSAKFTKAMDGLGDDEQSLGSLYVDVKATIDQVVKSGELSEADATAFRQITSSVGFESIAAGLSVQDNAVRLDVASPLTKDGPKLGDPAKAVAALPGDAWLALGIGDIQALAEYTLDSVSTTTALAGTDINTALEQLNTAFGVDIRKDLLAWMGNGAIFVRGTNLVDIGGALVVQSKDPAATKASMAKIQELVEQLGSALDLKTGKLSASGVDAGFTVDAGKRFPLPISVALAGDKFIVAVTDSALTAAIKPTGALGDNADFKAAAGGLGDGLQPVLYLGFSPVVSLVEGFGLGSNPDYAKAKPTLDALQALAAGGSTKDKLSKQRLVLTLDK